MATVTLITTSPIKHGVERVEEVYKVDTGAGETTVSIKAKWLKRVEWVITRGTYSIAADNVTVNIANLTASTTTSVTLVGRGT